MSTPQGNVEAYRLLGDILTALRAALRVGLEREYGPRWFAEALPPPLLTRLVERKEREKAVSVFDGSYFTLLEYTDFVDLREICVAHPAVATFLKAFGGNPQICQARFLELQGLHEKLAGLRDVNDAELSFLQHLARRLHQVLDPSAQAEPDRTVWATRPAHGGERQPPAEAPRAAAPAPVPVPAAAPPPPEAAPPPPVAAPRAEPPQPAPPAPVARSGDHGPRESRAEAARPAAATDLERALEDGDDKAVLAALFAEVRRLSEHMLDSQGPATPPVWDRVSESPWYARRYSSLGMRPVSDFYNLYLALRERIAEGAGNQVLQSFLQAHAYQQVVMAVGVFFQQNKVF